MGGQDQHLCHQLGARASRQALGHSQLGGLASSLPLVFQ